MMELEIDSIRVSLLNYQRVVILKEKEADRYLPIWIGPNEADAIAIKLQEVAVPRPLTHDLLHNVLGELGAEIQHILVSGLDHETFFAKIMVSFGEKTIPIDSRPSDALALAVRARVPIFADEDVLGQGRCQARSGNGRHNHRFDGQRATPDPDHISRRSIRKNWKRCPRSPNSSRPSIWEVSVKRGTSPRPRKTNKGAAPTGP